MKEKDARFARRMAMTLTGTCFIGMCVGAYRLSGFGVDAYTCLNLGVSGFLNMSFGNWQVIINVVILAVQFLVARSLIGVGTVVNLVGVGYMADFICWLFEDALGVGMTLPLRVIALLIGTVLSSLGVALCMVADMGVSPYDSVAMMIEKLSRGRVAFRTARVSSDVVCVAVGVAFCLLSHGVLWRLLGIGTVLNALFNGPIIQFFRTKVAEPLLAR